MVGKSNGVLLLQRFFHAVGDSGPGYFHTDIQHGLTKLLTVLRHVDRCARSTDHFNPIFLQYTFTHQVQGAVQRRLPAHGGQ